MEGRGGWRGSTPSLFSPSGFRSSNLMLLSLYSLRLGPVWRGEEDGGDPPQVCSLQAVSGPVILCYFPFTVCDWAQCGGGWRGSTPSLFSPSGFRSSNLMLLSLYSLRLGPVWRGEEDGRDPPQVCSLQSVSGPVISCYFPFTVCDWTQCGGERRMEGIHPKFVLSKRFPVQ